MTRRLMMLAALGLFLVSTTPAWAHDEYRIIGTVTKITAKMLDVKQTKDGKVVMIDILDTTIVTRETKKVAATELKVGLNVVVDARGDSIDELEAVEVKIVPPAKK
jgi:hypothetical protein